MQWDSKGYLDIKNVIFIIMKTPNNFIGNNIFKNLLLIILISIILVILMLFFFKTYTRHNQNVEVPQLQGLQVDEASVILKSRGLHIEIIDSIYQKGAVPGAIIEQTPNPKNNVKEGRPVYVTIYSKSPQLVTIPGLVDYSVRHAEALLISLGFNQLEIETVPSVYEGLIVSVQYRGKSLQPDEKIPVGSPLKLIVGSGQQVYDSTNIDREYIISPSEEIDSTENLDSSFF